MGDQRSKTMRSFIVWPLWNGAVTRWMVEEHLDDDFIPFIPVDSFESEQEAMDWINEKGAVFGDQD